MQGILTSGKQVDSLDEQSQLIRRPVAFSASARLVTTGPALHRLLHQLQLLALQATVELLDS